MIITRQWLDKQILKLNDLASRAYHKKLVEQFYEYKAQEAILHEVRKRLLTPSKG